MKAEERKHLKENELAERLGRVWQTVASGSKANTIIWGALLVAAALIIGWRYYSDASFHTRAAEWYAVNEASTTDDLKQIIEKNPGTVAARVAKFDLSRYEMDDALRRLAGQFSEDRVKAADTLVEVRARYAELAGDKAAEPELIQEAMMGTAKAEEVLAGVPKADNPKETRGYIDEAIKGYKALAEKYPDSHLGKEAAKRARELSDHLDFARSFYQGLIEVHGAPALALPPPTPPSTGGPALPPPTPPDPTQPPGATGQAPKAPAANQPKVAPPDPNPPILATPPTPTPIPPTAPPNGISPEGPVAPPAKPKTP